MAFNLASCPSGWSALAGATGRIIVGVGSNGTNSFALNATGGADSVVLSTANLPPHAHTVDPPSTILAMDLMAPHSHTESAITSNTTRTAGGSSTPFTSGGAATSANSAGTPTGTVDIASFSSDNGPGSSTAVDNRQAYYALLYCQKN